MQPVTFAYPLRAALAAWLLASSCAFAQTPPAPEAGPVDALALTGDPLPLPDPNVPDKSQYTLFNPTPDDQMRQFSTDRPGKTHSSLTVDAGHFQLESDFYNYTYDHYSPGGQTTRIESAATPILKAGITNDIDLEAAFDFYNSTRVTSRAGGGSTAASTAPSTVKGEGFGDVELGSKINIFGNDGGSDSLAVLPFVKIPTAAQNVGNGEVEYTVNLPYTHNFDTLWSTTIEEAFGWLRDTNDASHHADYSFLVNVNRPVIVPELTASMELAAEYAERSVQPRYTFDPALQYLVTPTFQLDMGIYIGLNKAAPDLNPYVGISFRY